MHPSPESSEAMNAFLRGGRSGQRQAEQPAPDESVDELDRLGKQLGCVSNGDLRKLLGEDANLSGAALRSRVERELRDREWLAPDFEEHRAILVASSGIEAGAHGDVEVPRDMNQALRSAAGPRRGRGWL